MGAFRIGTSYLRGGDFLRAVEAVKIDTLVDNFSDNSIDTALWPGNFGSPVETGGRARIPIDTGFNGYRSAAIYQLDESSVTVKVATFPADGGASEAYTNVLVETDPGAGTDAGFVIDVNAGLLLAVVRVGFADTPTSVAIDPVAHAWLRLSESAGTLTWATSADGASWSTLRTASSPAWVSDTDLVLTLFGHRANGTNDFAEFDNVNFLVTTGALAGTLGTVTADLNGASEGNGALAGIVSGITSDINGVSESASALAGTLGGVTADLNGTSEATAALAGTLGAVTGDLNGALESSGPLAGTLGAVTSDINGSSTSEGLLAGTLSGVTADMHGDASESTTGTLAGTLQPLTANIDGSSEAVGALAGQLVGVTADLVGESELRAALAGLVAAITADLAGGSSSDAQMAGALQAITADINVSSRTAGPLAGILQPAVADLAGESNGIAALAGMLSGVSADINGSNASSGAMAGVLSGVAADLRGTAGVVQDPSDLMAFFFA